ncbi:fluoride efflux transporter FluC [Sutcliffiella deserti]|uniref:fluoride efflux transporter FluC n=1 Tax=Sutcliffiella deserti TaxID=2875501 RepID=UPI001CC12AA3|nr:CrcB family protein [Sutcliffiella deserti]
MKMANVLAVFVGGMLGSALRYWVFLGFQEVGFWYGTVVVNVVGSFLLGALAGSVLQLKGKEWLKVGLGVGFCGGFTTMSTVGADTYLLAVESIYYAILYVMLTVTVGVALAFMGLYVGGRVMNKFIQRRRLV